MIAVVLDSTVFRSDPRRVKAATKVLRELCTLGKVRICVPSFVRGEFLSHRSIERSKSVQQACTALRDLGRREIASARVDLFKRLEEQVAQLNQVLERDDEGEFDRWLSQAGGEIVPQDPSDTSRVIDAYFAGRPPFKQRKSREDFPDAFIWQTVLRAAQQYKHVVLISNDGGFDNAVSGRDDVCLFKSIDDFLTSDACAPLKPHLATANFARLKILLPERRDVLLNVLKRQFVNFVASERVVSPQIPDDNNEGLITGVGEPDPVELRIEDAEYYGLGMFVIPFTAECECLVHFTIFKGDWYVLPPDESFPVSDWNDHYFEAEQDFQLVVEGTMSVQLERTALDDPLLSDEHILAMLEADGGITINSIEGISVAGDE